jgi:uncharacterized protein YbjT (DUF2867 family)
MKTALVAGSTGLVGKALVQQLINEKLYNKIIILSRKDLNYDNNNTQVVIIPDFDNLIKHKNSLIADDVFCCLGTTIKKAGSKENFKKIDFQYALEIAKITVVNDAKQFVLVSSMGADVNSIFFYNRVKGLLEQELKKLPFKSLLIVRPSLLLGSREEHRAGEKLAQKIVPLFSPFLTGSFKKYRAIEAEDVAKAMIFVAKGKYRGVHVFQSDEVQSFAGKS